jgi:hypothetical protein
LLGQSDFEWGIARLNVTATLAFGAVVKQHASTPSDTCWELQTAKRAKSYKCHQASVGLKSTSFNMIQTKNPYVVNT